MKRAVNFVGSIIFWRFHRGSWQYDILCGLILAFIFLTPRTVFDGSAFRQQESEAVRQEARFPSGSDAVDHETDLKSDKESGTEPDSNTH